MLCKVPRHGTTFRKQLGMATVRKRETEHSAT